MSRQLEQYQLLAGSLSEFFSPMLEVALVDPSGAICAVYNRLTTDEVPKVDCHEATKIFINKSQQAKLIYLPLENNFQLRLIAEITLFESLQVLLQKYLRDKDTQEEVSTWQQCVDAVIDDYLLAQNTSLNNLTAQDKRTLILAIHDKNYFRYQDATRYLACKLNVSRATIYNYLKQATEIKSIEIHQVDAFTDEPFSGNPAGVVLEADQLSELTMKKITREMNLSETSFLLKSDLADLRLRYFTPNGSEVKFCGHSTVGALYMLAHQNKFNINQPGYYPLKLETQIGILSVAVTLQKDKGVTIEFETPMVDLVNTELSHEEVSEALGIASDIIDLTHPIMFEKNNRDLYLTVKNLTSLEEVNIDQKSTKLFSEKHGIVAIALVTNETIAQQSHIHMRCFAPAVGIPEDPFTGSVLGGLATYIQLTNLIPKNLKVVRVEQGHFISRPGYVDLKLAGTNQPPLVLAKARHFFSTKIEL